MRCHLWGSVVSTQSSDPDNKALLLLKDTQTFIPKLYDTTNNDKERLQMTTAAFSMLHNVIVPRLVSVRSTHTMASTIHVQHKEVLSWSPPPPVCLFKTLCSEGRMGENRGNNGGLEVPFTCCAAVETNPPSLWLFLFPHAQIHGCTWRQVPSMQRSTGLTDSGSKSGKVAHTISRADLLFPAGEEAERLLRTWRTPWPFSYHHHLHQYILVHVWCHVCVYCMRTDSRCLCLHLKIWWFGEVKMVTGCRAELFSHSLLHVCFHLWSSAQTRTSHRFLTSLWQKQEKRLHINTLQCRLGWHTIFI